MIARSNLIRRAATVVFAIWSVGSFALHQLAFTEQLRLRGSSTAWRTAGVEDRLTAIATLAVGPFYRSMLAELRPDTEQNRVLSQEGKYSNDQ